MEKSERIKTSHIVILFTCLSVLFVLLGLSTANGQTTGSISGYVYESDCSTPISGVTIDVYTVLSTSSYTTTSDGTGQFTLDGLPEGDYFVEVVPGEGQNYISEYYTTLKFNRYVEPEAVHVTTGEITTLNDI